MATSTAGAFHSTVIPDVEFFERQRRFHDFLDAPALYSGDLDYKDRLKKMLKQRNFRFVININELRQYSQDMAKGLLQEPLEWIPSLEAAVRELAVNLNDAFDIDFELNPIHVGVEGSFGGFHTTPRHLSASYLGNMVCLDGIVTSCSLVRPKMLRSVHYNEARKQFVMREYYDATMIGGQAPTPINYPTTGLNGEPLTSEFGLSHYRDYQSVTMQELPEKAPAGQLPRSVDIIFDADLVDSVKPGDRVQVVGVYKSLASIYNGAVPATFRAVMIANNVRMIGKDTHVPVMTTDDVENIKAIARRKDAFELLARSLAPSIYGHAYIKKAVLMQLLGGVEKNLENGTHIRGDINLMLVGDPSTAKSQMLRFVLSIAPLAIATTGRGSSGVGLTAAVTHDKETGERRLEAGAMVLADRGVVCIDEFDKMSDVDRVAIHEVMEQQTVTIAKAGIHASLNARCSVLAAANPIWGQYRETASPQENIRLPDSLLSRFDLLFIVLDSSNPDHDRRISSHVLRMHRYTPAGVAEGTPVSESGLFEAADESDLEEDDSATAVFQRHYANTAAADAADEEEEELAEDAQEILALSFVKKYIHYARTKCAPVLTKSASEYIAGAYAEFRQKREQTDIVEAKTFPVTPRTLETLIRLATAHAKARLSNRVERKDAKVAQEMIQFCLYKEVKKKPSKRRKRVEQEAEEEETSEEETSEDDDEQAEELIPRQSKRTAAKKTQAQKEFDVFDPASIDRDNGKEKMYAIPDEDIEPALRDLNIIAAQTQSGASCSGITKPAAAVATQDSQSSLFPDSLPFLSQSQPTQKQEEPEPIVEEETIPATSQTTAMIEPVYDPAHEAPVRSALYALRLTQGDAISVADLRQKLPDISEAHIEGVLKQLEVQNSIMYREGLIYLI